MKISQLSSSERPREKLAARGVRALSDAELLAVILRSGTKQSSALEIAQFLFANSGGSLVQLASLSLDKLTSFPGIKMSKAVSVMAAFELGRRMVGERSSPGGEPLTGASGVYRFFKPMLKGLKHEECWVMFINKSNIVIGSMKVSSGGDDSTTIDVKVILREALSRHASAMVLVHNHPSGNPLPGNADRASTKSLKAAAEAMDLLLLDHVIVCDDCYYSFCDEEIGRA